MEWAAWSAGTGPPVGTSTQPSSSTTEETAEGVSSPKEQAAARDRRPSATSPVKAWKCRRSSRRVAARALGNGRRLVADLHAIREEWGHSITARRDSAVWRPDETAHALGLSRAQITALDGLRSRPRIDVAPVNSHRPS